MHSSFTKIKVEDLLNDTPTRGRTSHHDGKPRPDVFTLTCGLEKCSRKFATHESLQAHRRRSHASPTYHICSHCQSSFSTSPNLKKHIRTVHNKVKPFKCEACDRTFGFKDGLHRHVAMVHFQARPFGCPFCSIKFKTKAHLSKHSLALHPEEHMRSSPNLRFV